MTRTSALLFFLIPFALLGGPGCGAKKELDGTVDALVAALGASDYAAFGRLAHPGLIEKVSADGFAEMSETVKMLGAFKERTMRSVEVATGKPTEGSYELAFEKGTVQLALSVADGHLVSFNFTGDALVAAQRSARDARYRELAVREFVFVGDDGKPNARGNIYAQGGRVSFRVVVTGVATAAGQHKVTLTLALKDSAGAEVYRDVLPEMVQAADPSVGPVVSINASFGAMAKGTFRLDLELTDTVAKKTVPYTQAVTIE